MAICWLIPERILRTRNIPSQPALLSRWFVFSQERDVSWSWRVVFLWKCPPLLPFCFDIYRSRKTICCRCHVSARDGNDRIHGCLVNPKKQNAAEYRGVISIWSIVSFHVFFQLFHPLLCGQWSNLTICFCFNWLVQPLPRMNLQSSWRI